MIPKGTEIVCPKCGAYITTTAGDIVHGTLLSTKVMGLPEIWAMRRVGECADSECEGLFVLAGNRGMHTTTGWVW